MSNEVKTCDDCGWSCKKVWRFSINDCRPSWGATAKQIISLAAKHPQVHAQQDGYGYGSVGIRIGENASGSITLVLDVRSDGVCLRDVFWHRLDTPEHFTKLVELLAKEFVER